MKQIDKKTALAELERLYKGSKPALHYNTPYELLIAVILSAQCTDERVNIVCKDLFAKFDTAEKLAKAPLSEIEEIVKPCGLYRMKAKNIKDAMLRLVNEYEGVIPADMDELLKFEGVGRKIANLLLGDLYHQPAIVADTHCMRICGRLGMYKDGMKDPLKTEKIMSKLVEPSEQSDLCHRLVLFGREFCMAKNPKCGECPLSNICVKAQKEKI